MRVLLDAPRGLPVTPRAKLAAAEPFLKRVLADRKIYLIGGEDELGELAPDRKAKAARR
jgi:hypothetical protein